MKSIWPKIIHAAVIAAVIGIILCWPWLLWPVEVAVPVSFLSVLLSQLVVWKYSVLNDLERRTLVNAVTDEIHQRRFQEDVWSTCKAKAKGHHGIALADYVMQRTQMLYKLFVEEKRRKALQKILGPLTWCLGRRGS
jgi:hypothetical protein